jgi:hypothetical protein
MKLNGKKIEGPNIEIVVIPRGDGDDIVFKAKAVLEMAEYNKLYPIPEPPTVMRPGGKMSKDFEDKTYIQAITQYSSNQTHWMILQSLKATEGLEWETVDMADPNTWANYQTELKESGFNVQEINKIIDGVLAANCLDEKKIEAARNRFFMMDQLKKLEKSSQEGGQRSTPSGEPANA